MKLIFVYNADSNVFSQLTDAAHKIVSPSTYKCNLCRLTYGLVKERKEWTEFLKTFSVRTEFMHADEFHKLYPELKVAFPIVLEEDDDNIRILITTEELNACQTLDDLIVLVKKSIGE